MKIGIAWDKDGMIVPRFKETQQFKVYDVSNGEVQNESFVDVPAGKAQEMAFALQRVRIDTVICGELEMDAEMALMMVGIIYYADANGYADTAIKAFIGGKLGKETGITCDRKTCSGSCAECAGCA